MYYLDSQIEKLYRIFDQNERKDYLRLDLNENPSGLPQEFINDVLKDVDSRFVGQYPETLHFTEVLANHLGTDISHLCLVNGSAEGIRYIIQAFTSPEGRIVGVVPSYFMFQVYSEMYGRNFVKVPYNEDLTMAGTFIKYALNHEHVFVTRTFSKLFSLAGCRLGYVAGWPEGVKMVQKLCTPHNTNAFAMLFAEKILETPGVLLNLIDKFNEGRKYLIDELDANGYAHKGEAGNFIFIKTKTDAERIVARMKAEKRILIKSYPNVGEFGTCLRVSIGEKKCMKQFCSALFELDK